MGLQLPDRLILESIERRKIYKFSWGRIANGDPHFFVCVTKTSEIIVFTCCTSQMASIERYLEQNEMPQETIAYVSPRISIDRDLDQGTYINCNQCYTYPTDKFVEMYQTGQVKHSGELTLGEFENVLIGIHGSDLVDEEIKIIIPPPETKKLR